MLLKDEPESCLTSDWAQDMQNRVECHSNKAIWSPLICWDDGSIKQTLIQTLCIKCILVLWVLGVKGGKESVGERHILFLCRIESHHWEGVYCDGRQTELSITVHFTLYLYSNFFSIPRVYLNLKY